MKNKIVSLLLVAVLIIGNSISVNSISHAEEEIVTKNNVKTSVLENENSDDIENANDDVNDTIVGDENSISRENENSEDDMVTDKDAVQKTDDELDMNINNTELEDKSDDTDLSDDDLNDETDVVLSKEELTVEKAGAVVNSREMSTGTEDITAPTLVSITLDKTTIEAPGKIGITVKATDDVSGVDWGNISFTNAETGTTLEAYLNTTDEGVLYGEIDVTQYTGNGKYIIDEINVYDVADNHVWLIGYVNTLYDMYKNDVERLLPDTMINTSFTVSNNGNLVDTTAPELVNIILTRTNVEAPETIGVTIEATDDVSGIDWGNISFKNEYTGTTLSAYLKKTEDGKLYGEIDITQYTGMGEYLIDEINLDDVAGNHVWLIGYVNSLYDMYKNYPERIIPEALLNTSITVTNYGKKADVTTSTTSDKLVSEIDSISEDGIAVVDYSSNSKVSKDVFEAIANTNKTITFTSNGISWQFNGSNVNLPKEIDLNVAITQLSQYNSVIGSQISNLVGDKSALVLQFADNGQLPGQATIKIKTDYLLRQYLGTTGLQIYYYDNTNNKLELIASNVSVTSDNNIAFDIEHCSYYVVTGKVVNTIPSNNNNITYSSKTYDDSGNGVEEGLPEETQNNYTSEELTIMSYVGKEKIYAELGIGNKYKVVIQNSIQGSKCIDVYNFVKGEYTIGRTYNIFPINEFGIHSKDSTAKITLTIPKSIYRINRTYEMICVGANGMPYILEDQDTNPETITFETKNFYAFALCYKDVND